MSISRSGYYKWKYRKLNPSLRELTRQSDLELIKKVHNEHKAHGYRWINRFIINSYINTICCKSMSQIVKSII